MQCAVGGHGGWVVEAKVVYRQEGKAKWNSSTVNPPNGEREREWGGVWSVHTVLHCLSVCNTASQCV